MLTRVDHVMVCVPDLGRATDAYARLGFDVRPGGAHPGRGTHNALAWFDEDYLELLAVRDARECAAADGGPGLLDFVARGGGLRYVAIQSDDLDADVLAMRGRGVDVTAAAEGARRTPDGRELRWRAARLGAGTLLPVFFIQHLTPLAERRGPAPGLHANSVLRTERVYVAVPDVRAAATGCARVLGMPVPPVQRGAVIKADMAVFDLGPTGLTLAQPAEPGPAAEALARQGPGPFQVLYRTASLDAAARAMAERGLPPLARGVRNTGEQAMLAGPEVACGAYVGFVGTA